MAFTGENTLNNGWDDPASNSCNGGPNYEGELTLNNKDKSISLVVNGIWGPNVQPALGTHHSNSNLGAIDPIFTWKPSFVPNLTLQTEYLYASQEGPVINGHSASWQGVAQYLVYDWTPQIETATRGEIFDDMDGAAHYPAPARRFGIGRSHADAQLQDSRSRRDWWRVWNTGMTIRVRTCSPIMGASIRRPAPIFICGTGRILWPPTSFTPSNNLTLGRS